MSPDAYWSSDVIPTVTGKKIGLGQGNRGFSPDFTALADLNEGTAKAVAVMRHSQVAAQGLPAQ